MKITITLDKDELPGFVTEQTIVLLLMDALYEFEAHRGPTAEAYVDRRYPEQAPYQYSASARTRKIDEVKRRIEIARQLHRAVGTTLTVERE